MIEKQKKFVGLRPRFVGAKKLATRFLTCYPMAAFIRWIYAGKIPSQDGIIDLTNTDVPISSHALIYWNIYESAERRFVERYIQRDLDTVELGASLGVISTAIATRLQPKTKMIAVEANPKLKGCLTSTLSLNGSHLDLRIVFAAGGYEMKTVAFCAEENNLVSKSVEQHGNKYSSQSSAVDLVSCVTLKEIVEKSSMNSFQLICDIEGMEWELLRNDEEILRRCNLAIIEAHNYSDKQFDEFFTAFETTGMRLIDRYGAVGVFKRQKR